MTERHEPFLTASQVALAIRRRFIGIVFITAVMTSIGLGVLLQLLDTYSSEGAFYLNAGRGTVTIDPTATTSQVANLMETRQSEIQSIKDMIGSRGMLERTAARVGPSRLLAHKPWWTERLAELKAAVDRKLGRGEKTVEGMSAAEVAHLQETQEAVEYLASRIVISGDKEGNTVQVRGKAHTSVLAHDIVEALMAEFKEHYVDVHRTVGSRDFFERELIQSQRRVCQAESEMADFKNTMKAISLESKRELLHQQLAYSQDELLKTEAEVAAKSAEIVRLNALAESQPEMLAVTQTARSSAAADAMRSELYRLEIQSNDLAAKYSADHPLVQAARVALEDARETFEAQDAMFGERSEAINPVRQELTITRMKAESLVDANRSKAESLRKRIDELQTDVAKLNLDEVRLAELTRQVDLYRDELRDYARKREESRRQEVLDESLISALQISQHASHVIEKSGPPRLAALAVIGFVSLLMSCCLAVWREQVDAGYSLTDAGGHPAAGRHAAQPNTRPGNEGQVYSGRITGPSRNGPREEAIQVRVSDHVRPTR